MGADKLITNQQPKKITVSKDEKKLLAKEVKLNKEKEVKTLSKGTKPTAYQCSKCFYKWNRDPNLRCAMCSEFGPYKPHNGKLG